MCKFTTVNSPKISIKTGKFYHFTKNSANFKKFDNVKNRHTEYCHRFNVVMPKFSLELLNIYIQASYL